jgi:urease accessory protein
VGAGLTAGARTPAAGGLSAHAIVETARGPAGATCLRRLRSAAPLSLRETPSGVYLVGTAAGPLGGDRLRLDLDVAAGTTLHVRSAASTVVLPGAGGEESVLTVTARVGAGAVLSFRPEPTVLAAGCRHRVVARLDLEPGATVAWREEVCFGRHGEAGGRYRGRIEADLDGVPLLRQDLVAGEECLEASPAVFGGARCAGSVLLAGPACSGARAVAGDGWAVLPLSAGGVVVSALASDAVTLRERLAEGERRLSGQNGP